MADITDSRVVKFSNEEVQPIAERMRDMQHKLTAIKLKWDTEVSSVLSGNDSADVLIDGRASQGVSVLTKNDIVGILVRVNDMLTLFNASGVMDVITKPCVRSLGV